MSRGLGWLLAVILFAAGCWWMYGHVAGRRASGNGDVFIHNDPSDSGKDLSETSTKEEPTAAPAAIPAATPAAPTVQPEIAPLATTQPAVAPPATAAPVADSIAPNPANGMAFGGSGKYQWYRQGNLTWRIDTTSGTSCIDFATMEEWNKPVVYSHGCGNSRRS